MRVSPLDIRKQTLKRSMRGADQEEVRMFLDVVASEYEKVLQENAMMTERIRALEARVLEFRQLEESMRNSLVTADRIASEARDASEREARRVVQDAHMRAERILEDARERLQSLIREIEALRGKKEVYARRFWTLIESQIAVLQDHLGDVVDVEALRQRISQLAPEKAAAPAGSRAGADAVAPGQATSRAAEELVGRASESARASDVPTRRLDRALDGAEASRDRHRESGAPPDPAEIVPALESTPVRRELPRGLGRLLRGRQPALPLLSERGNVETALTGGPTAGRSDQDLERREGLFEISAADAPRRDQGSWIRDRDADEHA